MNGTGTENGDSGTGLREVMDVHLAADYLGISVDTMYRYAIERRLPAFKIGNRWRFHKRLLDAWMDEKSAANSPREGVTPR